MIEYNSTKELVDEVVEELEEKRRKKIKTYVSGRLLEKERLEKTLEDTKEKLQKVEEDLDAIKNGNYDKVDFSDYNSITVSNFGGTGTWSTGGLYDNLFK